MLQIADKIVFDRQIALIHVHDERQTVHILNRRPGRGEGDAPIVAVRQTANIFQRLARCNVGANVIKLSDRNPIHRRRGIHRLHRQDAYVRADHADHDLGIYFLQVRGKFRVVCKGRRARVQHRQFVVLCQGSHLLDRQAIRGSIDKLATGDHGRGLRQPGRIPK